MSNCTYKVKIKDIQNNYKVIMEDIQNKYKFKIFCTGNSYDDTEIREEIEALQDELDEAEEELEQYKTIYNALPKVTGEGTNITLNNTANSVMKFKEYKGNTYQKDKLIPDEYTQVDYIESDGTQYIDTGVNADSNLSVKTEIAIPTMTGAFGAISNASGIYVRHHFNFQSSQGIRYYILESTSYQLIPQVDTDTNRHDYDIDIYNHKIVVDSGTPITTASKSFDVGLNYWLFRRNANTDNLRVYSVIKLYKFKMYYNNVLVRDFIPCYRNSDNEVGLYDLVNGVFYTDDASSSIPFTYGSVVGIPNPDYPQKIEVVTGNQNVEVCGKNLFDHSQFVQNELVNGITASIENGYLKLNGTPNSANDSISKDVSITNIIKNLGTSTFNTTLVVGTYPYTFRIYEKDENNTIVNRFNGLSKTLTYTKNHTYSIRAFVLSNTTLTNINCKLALQIEQGNQATAYEPYQSQSYPVNLGNTELCKIGDYQDKIYKQNDKWYLEKNTGKVILDGTQTITATTQNNVFYLANITDYRTSNNTPYSNYYKGIINVVGAIDMASKDNNTIAFLSSSSPNARCYIKDTRYTNASDLTLWLSTHNTTLYYALATPTTTEITDTTLIGQLETISKQLAYKGQTNIIVSGNLPVIINVETLKDLSVEETPVASVNRLQSIRPTIIQPEINNIEEQPEEIEEEIPEQE